MILTAAIVVGFVVLVLVFCALVLWVAYEDWRLHKRSQCSMMDSCDSPQPLDSEGGHKNKNG